jgi:hypothetical protein
MGALLITDRFRPGCKVDSNARIIAEESTDCIHNKKTIAM